jgi:hypothetical protein
MGLFVTRVLALCALGLALGACGDKPQGESKPRKSDVSAYQGGTSGIASEGWKAGDPVSWEAQMKARAQYGQNEYSRSAP